MASILDYTMSMPYPRQVQNVKHPKEKHFTYVLSDPNDYKHTSGINCVKVGSSIEDVGAHFLFTGSRDGTVKRWELGADAPKFGATLQSHTDWVNDVVLAGVDTLVSCSSDTTLKTWRAFSNSECTHTFKQHKDSVMSLAVPRQKNNIVASGGLSCELFLWDLEASTTPIVRASTMGLEVSTSYGCLTSDIVPRIDDPPTLSERNLTIHQKEKGNKSSIYSVSINDASTTLVSGGLEKDIRVWDPRTGTKQMKLRGHTQNVRTLVLDPTGRLCISGSSDSIIKLWDLGQQCCIDSYYVHSDSVWTLAATPSFSHVYSGGRDKSVFVTDLTTRESKLLCFEEHPVLQIALQGDNSMWIATENSSLNKWPAYDEEILPRVVSNVGSSSQLASENSSASEKLPMHSLPTATILGTPAIGEKILARVVSNVGSSSQVASENSSASEKLPLHSLPTATILGTPAIVRHEILKDSHHAHRHVLTQDSAGMVKRWEITRGTAIDHYGVISFQEFEEKVKELSLEPSEIVHKVPAWFTTDTKFGVISVHLDAPQCFAAVINAMELQIPDATVELKLNLGWETLRGIFATWSDQRRHRVANASTSNPDVSRGTREIRGEKGRDKKGKGQVHTPHDMAENQHIKVLQPFVFSTTSSPLIITEGSEGGQWVKRSTDLDGTEDEKKLPRWCIECVLGPPTSKSNSSPAGDTSNDTLNAILEYMKKQITSLRVSCTAERRQADTSGDANS